MPDAPQPPPTQPANYREIAQQQVAGLVDLVPLDKLQQLVTNAIQEGGANAIAASMRAAIGILAFITKTIAEGEDQSSAALADLLEVAVKDLLDIDVNVRPLRLRGGKKVSGGGDAAMGGAVLEALTRGGATMEPSDEGAKRFLTTLLNFTLEGWVQATTVNTLTAIIPGVDAVTQFGELDDMLSQVLGLGRMSRRVIGPLMTARVITPFQWHVNKQYRPELLSPAAAIEAFLAGRYTGAQLVEELSRQGWSDERINIQVANAAKRLPFADLVYQHYRGVITDAEVVERARSLGYDAVTATELLDLENAKRRDRWRDPIVDAAVAAFIAREIEESELRSLVEANAPSHAQAQFIISAATVRRGYRRHHLSSADARRLALKQILNVVDFRRALEREGWTLEAITALELELRQDLDAQAALEDLREQQAAERAAEKARREQERIAREAELAERRALPALTEYRRAYVRGIITRDTFAEAITREKIAITGEDLALLLEDADVDRSARLEELERRAVLALRDDPALPIASMESAVLRGILTLDQFAFELRSRGFSDDEVHVFTALLHDRIERQAEADAARQAAAERAAAAGGLTVADFERAVRLGVRSMDSYADFLAAIDTPALARALILDRLEEEIERDQAARDRREQLDAEAAAKAINLSLRRRAVLAGVRPRAYYESSLRDAAWPAEDQVSDLALLDVELKAAAARAAKRDELAAAHEAARVTKEAIESERASRANAAPPAPTLSLAQLERAVKLGLLPPDALRAELSGKGYGADNVELLMAMIVAAIPDAREGERRWTAIAGELAAKGIGLADFERAVKRGFRTMADYEALLTERGYGEDDVLLLRLLLEDEIALEQAKLQTAIAARLAKQAAAPPLDEILAAVVSGELTLDTFRDVLVHFGVDPTTALLFARMVFAFGPEV